MDRKALARTLVLNEIADDYEHLDHISPIITTLAEKCRVTFDRQELINALSELIKLGLAKAYNLEPNPPRAFPGVPSLAEFGDFSTYCYITGDGKIELHRMDWPFDDSGELLPDFVIEP